MKVRATRSFNYQGKTWREGDVISLSQDRGIHLLQAGSVEPVVDLEPFRPPLDSNGLTLWEAYLLHVRGFPSLKPLLYEDHLKLQRGRLRVRKYVRRPEWPGLPAAQSERLRRPHSSYVRRGLFSDDAVSVRLSAQDPWSRSGPSLEERYQQASRNYLRHAAIHFFFERLANEELDAVGVSENDLDTLKKTRISAGWWRRDIMIDLGRDEIREFLEANQTQWTRRYSEVRILPPTASKERRRRGRRSRREEMAKAFHELLANESLARSDLTNKKGVWSRVLRYLGYSEEASGCSYNTFVKHIGPLIDKQLETRDSEN